MASIFYKDCTTLNKVGIISIAISSISIIENSFPLYILLKSSTDHLDDTVQTFARTIRVYLLALIVTDILGAMVVMPMFLLTELTNMICWREYVSSFDTKTLCAVSYASYFAYKLASMFLITFTGYSCFLHYNQNFRLQANANGTIDKKNCVCEAQPSLTTAASSQSNQSNNDDERNKNTRHQTPRRGTMRFMLILIVIFSLCVAFLPLLGLGPFNYKITEGAFPSSNTTKATTPSQSSNASFSACMLHSFAKPKTEKEYIFLFSLLMASGVCGLILVYTFIALFGGRFKSSHSIFAEMTQFVTVQGFLFLATWIPVLISICFAMSGKIVTHEVQSYLILITFLNCLSHPFFYGYCLSMVRDGYKDMLRCLRCLMKCLLSKKKSQGHTPVATEDRHCATTL